ncbi:MAG: TolC family protein [Labilibaculum sp.]|nr:TolC family protein [Labilibaculum sp.]
MIQLINIKKMKVHILFLGLSIFSLHAVGQSFTLKQCIDYAQKNNGDIINANYDIDIAQKRVNEEMGSMFPQIDASSAYTNNLKLNTTVLPGEILGQPGTNIAVQMGTQHNVSGGVQLSQKIFDPHFGTSLKATQLSKKQSELALKQTTEQIQYDISYLYYQTLVIKMQMNSLQVASNSSKALMEATELRFKNGMAKQIDVDRIKVSHNNTRSQLNQIELSCKQSLNNLKYSIGMPVDSLIVLADSSFNIEIQELVLATNSSSFENRTDYQLQKLALNSYELEKKLNATGYLPSLSFNAYYGVNAMRDEFDFFNNGDWHPNSYIGLSLRIPVFDGMQRQSRIAQSKLEIEKSKVTINQFQELIKVELSNSEIQYQNAIDNIQSEQANLNLAESVLKSTQLQYEQGTSSALDLVQAESSYRESFNNYYNKLLNYYIAQINLEHSKGTLTEYLNNLK